MQKAGKKRWTLQGTLCLLAFTALIIYMIIPCFLWSPIFTSIVIVPWRAEDAEYKASIDHSRHKPVDVFFDNGHGDKLHGWYYKNPAATKIVLVHHGNAGNISTRYQLGDFLADCGASVLLYDYRGYGKSTGKPDVAAIMEDGRAASDFVTGTLGFKPEQVIHYGESIGSGIACDVAAKRPSAGLVMHSGLSSLPSVGRRVFAFLRPYPDIFFPVPQMRNIDTIKAVHVPVLLFAAIPDTIVSYHEGEAVFANANEPKRLVLLKESGHNCTVGADCALVENALRKFVQTGI